MKATKYFLFATQPERTAKLKTFPSRKTKLQGSPPTLLPLAMKLRRSSAGRQPFETHTPKKKKSPRFFKYYFLYERIVTEGLFNATHLSGGGKCSCCCRESQDAQPRAETLQAVGSCPRSRSSAERREKGEGNLTDLVGDMRFFSP